MGLDELLSADGVLFNLKARCKREALGLLAEKAAALTGASADAVRATLLEREQLGSTGVGAGVAIPHGKIEGLSRVVGVLARLETPIDFDSVDDQPVDLIFLLLAPANATAAHLKALAKVSRLLRDEHVRATLRGAQTAEALFAVAIDAARPHAA
ncbi:PTS sugar transporter subunit IIA [Amphiplicatus metriothermophilus]|uniref:PTS IIA-like nitrogen-regulatory protein PtsN n=1 Tax=Amphiplicatus metriothermophilus TaxID=1519374 RepID=A0A239PLX5_9PROT|nr:PTS sugar transporter subunit IIA [Amphiplicatus metriothermophilus]SNT68363.1 PTS IIA-like nitrogen-regulatory protein PtsN [Amphiplicatus metriothermophilus]